ncbi:PREDICTED: taste receptor type 2 member 14-like [Chinchilla lanigera]|uniref:taste receptor type 2 member 14-like n=1 Tax=Chinchilla lanigera TaxID=34839 RepID=UPI00038F13A6|nr:PREDICTED: taste receptor type 2 member 14-like [Chinchilla lanigera]
MRSVTESIFTIIFSVEFTTGNLGNGFIILVSCMDTINRRKISVADHLLTALAISRIVLLWIILTGWWIHVFYPGFLINVVIIRIFYVIWTVGFHFNAWLATCLSIFYCLKIANFSNSIFLYFKWRVKKVVSLILLVCLVLLFLHLLQSNIHVNVLIDGYKRRMSYNSSLYITPEFPKLLLFSSIVFTFIAFALSLTMFLLLVFSLWKHLKRMQHSVIGSRDVSTTAHTKALQAVVVFLLLYTTFFLSIFIQLWRPEFLPFIFYHIVEIAFPSVHSFVLVLGSTKLKQASLSLLRSLRCGSKDAESSGS